MIQIYLNSTLQVMCNVGLQEEVQKLLDSGKIKTTESGLPYLMIEEDE